MAAASYTCGPTYARNGYATFETKAGEDSGAGYERWRSVETRPHTPRRSKEDVYVPHHRLLAVVACYPDDMAVSEILAHLRGKDVHHTTGIKWLNVPSFDTAIPELPNPPLAVRDHGAHSSITQAHIRAWGEDARERADADPDPDRCGRCGEAVAVRLESDDWDGLRCHDCAREDNDGSPIRVVG